MFAGTMNPGLVQFPGAMYAHNGARIIPVHNSGPGNLADAPSWWNDDGRTSVQLALSLCRSGRGDIIQLLPGHAETIGADAWSNLAATGVTVRGPDYGPPATFTWNASGSTMLFDTSGFVLDGGPNKNIVLEMAGDPASTTALTVTAPITISATRCGIRNVLGRMSVDADQLATVPILLSDAADDCFLIGNNLFGGAGAVTTGVDIAGADRLRMWGNSISGTTSSATVGIVRFKTTAATDVWLEENFYANRKSDSSVAVTGVAGVTGFSRNELFLVLTDGTTLAWGTSSGSMAFFNSRISNQAGEHGMLATVAST